GHVVVSPGRLGTRRGRQSREESARSRIGRTHKDLHVLASRGGIGSRGVDILSPVKSVGAIALLQIWQQRADRSCLVRITPSSREALYGVAVAKGGEGHLP